MWGAIIQLIVLVLGFVLDKIGADMEMKRLYLAFVSEMGARNLIPAKLTQSYRDQLARLNEEPPK